MINLSLSSLDDKGEGEESSVISTQLEKKKLTNRFDHVEKDKAADRLVHAS